ncbi:pantoate--beta-alanine ligase [Phaeodactylibacter luteus]|uniref:Pantothenate synthetase n=1 Tax=Phaeodactylibacter luteus TaxID=1564516 RepID=A0A5C6S041_9BACT|nr:pantoate--beta-alanine ligase [Phaeodactylibacter luteus]TXB67921.1 pantoate--beta-alanine ligase [Phaeodactylibacter luteus]
MYLFKKASDLQTYLQPYRSRNRTVAFVPTMGALHQGHLSLIAAAAQAAQCTVCSIFVNPTQFNEASDLQQYPRLPEQDLELLHNSGCQAVFMPEVEEVYPAEEEVPVPDIDFGHLAAVMEGEFRPGHFAGVAQVVNRLLSLVQPDLLFLGQKDYQQLQIVKSMVKQLQLPVEVVGAPTVREADGLAMSSRNLRLSKGQRQSALAIYGVLQQLPQWAANGLTVAEAQQKALAALSNAGLRPEYVEIAAPDTLQPLSGFVPGNEAVACIAAWAGPVRLIDNMLFTV